MTPSCTFQVHYAGRWQDAASMAVFGAVETGWRVATYTGYNIEYAVNALDRRDAVALSVGYPVGLVPLEAVAWPGFVMDLLPQGYGRLELLRQLGLPETAEAVADWPLLLAGAGNPIGNLRVKEAHAWLVERTKNEARRGFTVNEVAERSEDFAEYLAQHGIFVAGSSGVQGEWPKILLTQAEDGLFYLDHALPDERARAHYLVKFGRGTNPQLASILRLEAPYMQLARHLGLRVSANLELRERALFIPRFDRAVHQGAVVRHAQESLASVCGLSGFGVVPTHNQACTRLASMVSDPLQEVIEYLRRDIANIALGNKDNHARNTAIQRTEDGRIALTPVFDFAPMFLHPDGIARRMRWEQDDNGAPRWASVVDQVCAATRLPKDPIVTALRAMAKPMQKLADMACNFGVDAPVIDHLRPTIDNVARQLAQL